MKREQETRKSKGAIYETSSLYLEPKAPITFLDAEKMIGGKIQSISAKENVVNIELENGDVIHIAGGSVDVSLIKKK